MAEQGSVAAREHSRKPAAASVDAAVPDRKRFSVKRVKATGPEPSPRRVLSDPELLQLSSPDHPMLPIRKPCQRHPPHLAIPAQTPVPATPMGACPSFPCHMDP
jgi:hypothetical protein